MRKKRYEVFPASSNVFIDIRKARKLIALREATTFSMDVKQTYNPIKRGYVGVNEKFAMEGKLQNDPILVMTVAGVPCVIDGWHRVYRAYKKRQKWISAVMLLDSEVAQCAIAMHEWKARR